MTTTSSTMQRSSQLSSGVSSINLSSLALQDNTSNASLASRSNTSSTLSLRRGWGSTESRTACMSLDTLAASQSASQHPSLHRTLITPPTDDDMEVDNWGFFVDVPAEDEDMNAPGLSW
jgi:hypothetical protein